MSHLAKYLADLREKQGLSRRDVAGKLGYANLDKGCRRIETFEESSGTTKPRNLPEKIAFLLGADTQHVKEMINLDKLEWQAWLDETVPMRLVIRWIPAVYSDIEIPATVKTPGEAEAYAKEVAKEKERSVCLVVSRRLSIWIDNKGEVYARTETTPDRPNEPYMKVGNKKFQLNIDGEKKVD